MNSIPFYSQKYLGSNDKLYGHRILERYLHPALVWVGRGDWKAKTIINADLENRTYGLQNDLSFLCLDYVILPMASKFLCLKVICDPAYTWEDTHTRVIEAKFSNNALLVALHSDIFYSVQFCSMPFHSLPFYSIKKILVNSPNGFHNLQMGVTSSLKWAQTTDYQNIRVI